MVWSRRRRPVGDWRRGRVSHAPRSLSTYFTGTRPPWWTPSSISRPWRDVHDSPAHGCEWLEKGPQIPGHHRNVHDEVSGPSDRTEYAGNDAADRRRLLRQLLRSHAEHQFHLQLWQPPGRLLNITGGMISPFLSGRRWRPWQRSRA